MTTATLPTDLTDPTRPAAEATDPAVRCALAWHAAGHLVVARFLGLELPVVTLGGGCEGLPGEGRDGALVAVAGPRCERQAPNWRRNLVVVPCPGDEVGTFGRHRHGLVDELDEVLGGVTRVLDGLAVALKTSGTLTPDDVERVWSQPWPSLRSAAEAFEADVQYDAALRVQQVQTGDLTGSAATRRRLQARGYR